MPDLLQIERLSAGYGDAVVLADISLSLAEGGSLALLGRNGMGKTTLINSIIGVTPHRGGTIRLAARHHRAVTRPTRARRHRLGAAGAQYLQVAHRRGKPDRGRASRALGAA
jgi:branched-chain amino acid transport system ATP-binding protein